MFYISPRDAYYQCWEQNKRIVELETFIVLDIDYSYLYVKYVIHCPFILCHQKLLSSLYRKDYLIILIDNNHRDFILEELI